MEGLGVSWLGSCNENMMKEINSLKIPNRNEWLHQYLRPQFGLSMTLAS